MAIVRHDPWALLEQFRREMDRVYDPTRTEQGEGTSTADWVPAVDVREETDRFTILADVPGVNPKDIELHSEQGMLTIRGERNPGGGDEREGYKRVERPRGTFYRRFTLPDTANTEAISARCENGVLEVVIPKQERHQPRKITVEA